MLVWLKKNNETNKIAIHDARRRELVALGFAIRSKDVVVINKHIVSAKKAGASDRDIQKVFDFVIGDRKVAKYTVKKVVSMSDHPRCLHNVIQHNSEKPALVVGMRQKRGCAAEDSI